VEDLRANIDTYEKMIVAGRLEEISNLEKNISEVEAEIKRLASVLKENRQKVDKIKGD
jgi:uncharacterized coiled-coil DUF342 family protein